MVPLKNAFLCRDYLMIHILCARLTLIASMAAEAQQDRATTVESDKEFCTDPSGGAGYGRLRDGEKETLKLRLNDICEQETKISPQDIEIRKGKVMNILPIAFIFECLFL